jgi:hypothetical protein
MLWSLFMQTILRISLLLCLFSIVSTAQEQIDVKSMTISVNRFATSTAFNLVANNANNQEVRYFYGDSSAISFSPFGGSPFVAMCNPCRMPGVYSTLGWQFPSFTASLGGVNSNLRAKITFSNSSVTSDNVLLRPYVSKRRITVRGKTTLPVAKVEILDSIGPNSNTVIAYDNDVTLDGNYILYLKPGRDGNQKSIVVFEGITYTFDEPRN